MSIVAAVFLVCVALRFLLFLLDDGFGGWVWQTIYFTSSFAWLMGVVLALNVLLDLHVDVAVGAR